MRRFGISFFFALEVDIGLHGSFSCLLSVYVLLVLVPMHHGLVACHNDNLFVFMTTLLSLMLEERGAAYFVLCRSREMGMGRKLAKSGEDWVGKRCAAGSVILAVVTGRPSQTEPATVLHNYYSGQTCVGALNALFLSPFTSDD